MTIKKSTFSRQVKDELSLLKCGSQCCQQAELSAAFYGAGRFADRTITLFTAHAGSADRLSKLIRQYFKAEPVWQTGRELVSLTIDNPSVYAAICTDLKQLFGFDPETGANGQLSCTSQCCRQSILRALFLSCGSISDPSTAYHLELSIRRPEAAQMAVSLLAELSIRAGILHRHGHEVVYLTEGQYIADFLVLTGAHNSLLAFESLRVDKDMRNSVNRVVNCDSANSQRVANTVARQLDLLRQLAEKVGVATLPSDLQQTAEVRLENPDLSLKELGEKMQPPLGKSGMYHRLIRLEKKVAELLTEKGHMADGT